MSSHTLSVNARRGAGVLLAATALSTMSTDARAAGFALLEQTGSGAGYSYAGSAASADDASVMYFNPAGLGLITEPQVAVALHGIDLSTKFDDRGSVLPPAGLGALPGGATRSDAGDVIPLPNAYVAWPITEHLTFGFGINAPFGLVTEYDDPWVGRFQGIRSELVTINANPAIAYRMNDYVSFGFGVNYQYADAELTNAVLLGPGVEGRAELDVDDSDWGWNAGVLFTLPSRMRIGLSYRSRVDYSLSGDTTVTTLAGDPVAAASGPTTVEITFPDSALVSFAQPVGERVELRADVMWTNWSEVSRIAALNPATGLPRDVLEFGFEDAWRIAFGIGYRASERWSFRAGTAWDESPVTDRTRTVRLPDANRWWLSLGARWQPTERFTVDAGYVHLFVDDPDILHVRGQLGAPESFTSVVRGTYDSAVDILSVQLSWSFR
ncbi:MAG: OmpP1/FadL family transporter [Pseudomonadota bacterium]|jgi:Long-chain fatty acid transport protein